MLGALGAASVAGLAGCTSNGGGGGSDGGGDGSDGSDGGGTATPTEASTETATDGGDGTTTGEPGTSGTVRIGVLQPISGDLQYYGRSSLWGFFSGFAHKAGTDPITDVSTGTRTATVGDVDYELLIRDTQLSADQAQSLATDLVQNEEVDLLFGCTSSASADRVIKTVSKQVGIPTLVGPAASASVTASSETCAENVFRASENTAMDARSGGAYVARNTDVSKVYLFGADYSFGQAVVANYRTVLEQEGVEIVGEKFVPRGYSEWEGLLDNARSAGAEGIVAGFTVATLPQLFTTYLNGDYSFRIFGGFATEITNTILGQTLGKVLGTPLTEADLGDVALGPFTTRYHWNQFDNPINDAFVDMHTNAFGKVPDLFAGGMFASSSAIVQAVESSGSTEGADIQSALRGMTVAETPKGEDSYVFQEYNNQARSEMTVANPVPTAEEWSDVWGAAIQPSEPLARIGMDSTTIPADSPEMGCSL
jgi:branched-chain amino acid transport system substrate-binding protein